jgi:alkaline phosphatase D
MKDFSFIAGSCAHLDITLEDSTGTYYKGDTSIYYQMSVTPADFVLWLGDNWYLDKTDWTTAEGLQRKAREARTAKVMQRLIKRNIPQYAIWDDHDFGPNQSMKDYTLKSENRQVFMNIWSDNPSYGENNEGVYTSFKYNDVLFILLDDRWWRDRDDLWDYKWIKPNKNKRMFGKQQMSWLKKILLEDTTSSFKIIVNGSQMINPWSETDGFIHYPYEYKQLMRFVKSKHIKGVLFMSGDKHYSEINKLERKGTYPLYDITVSPLTSSPNQAKGTERLNKYRVDGSLIETYNFANVSISGSVEERRLTVQYYDQKRMPVFKWSVNKKELGY